MVALDAGVHVQTARKTTTAAFRNVVISVLSATKKRVTRSSDDTVQVLVVVDLCLYGTKNGPRSFRCDTLRITVRITDEVPDEYA